MNTTRRLQFSKMQGIGNDFVVIDAIRQPVQLSPAQLRFLADRHFGIGCDQILFAAPATEDGADFRYRIFNADGGEVEQCGNGVRCLAVFLAEQGLSTADELVIQTLGGPTRIQRLADSQIRVDMGPPRLAPPSIPFEAATQDSRYALEVDGRTLQIGAVSMGNPHAVLQVDELDTTPVERLGPLIEAHPRFPKRVNVGFMQVLAPDHIRLRVFERGVGETLACGTGACAAAVVGQIQGVLGPAVRVDLPGGRLHIEWQGGDNPVWMTGPAQTVFEGQVLLPDDDNANDG
ncbi:diaminopimelate epimerase [Methylonatrum kenyense]|uniref:diaminopimelate epimerase n=1 Tax=Methylonatrum kenyense TaxID=455253 RepID=UPI0020C0C7FE|nr:diaminopimelate epimerase [Methylonatrum kenyense]MCK8515290.1 diaminopimelate epimerase [Methylonatrum kenyense]